MGPYNEDPDYAAECFRMVETMNPDVALIRNQRTQNTVKKEKTTNDFARLSFSVGMRRLERPTPTSRT